MVHDIGSQQLEAEVSLGAIHASMYVCVFTVLVNGICSMIGLYPYPGVPTFP